MLSIGGESTVGDGFVVDYYLISSQVSPTAVIFICMAMCSLLGGESALINDFIIDYYLMGSHQASFSCDICLFGYVLSIGGQVCSSG